MVEEKITWFVGKFPRDKDQGQVLWDKEYPTKEACEAECKRLQALEPDFEFEATDLPELEEVWKRDVVPVFESLNATKH